MTIKEKNELIARQGLKLLLDKYAYRQIDIKRKFETLGIATNASSISLLFNNKKVGLKALKDLSKGITDILKAEQCLVFHESEKKFIPIENCTKKVIFQPTKTTTAQIADTSNTYIIHKGRIDVPEKVKLYRKASQEIIEIGLQLRNFTTYFSAKQDSKFLLPIEEKLEAGVHFKCYILAPDSTIGIRYFEDRNRVQRGEIEKFNNSSKILADLEKICLRLNKKGYEGKMSLFTYNNFPYFHASVIDGDSGNGLMYMSAYLYGIARANTPVIEVHQKVHKKLFKRYWSSIIALTSCQTITRIV